MFHYTCEDLHTLSYKPNLNLKPCPHKCGAAIYAATLKDSPQLSIGDYLVLTSIEKYDYTRGQCMITHSLSVPLGMFLGTEWIPRPWQSTVFPRQLQGAGHASTPPRPATSSRTPHASIVRSPDRKAAAVPQPPDPAPSPLLPAGILLSPAALQHTAESSPTDPGMTDHRNNLFQKWTKMLKVQ